MTAVRNKQHRKEWEKQLLARPLTLLVQPVGHDARAVLPRHALPVQLQPLLLQHHLRQYPPVVLLKPVHQKALQFRVELLYRLQSLSLPTVVLLEIVAAHGCFELPVSSHAIANLHVRAGRPNRIKPERRFHDHHRHGPIVAAISACEYEDLGKRIGVRSEALRTHVP